MLMFLPVMVLMTLGAILMASGGHDDAARLSQTFMSQELSERHLAVLSQAHLEGAPVGAFIEGAHPFLQSLPVSHEIIEVQGVGYLVSTWPGAATLKEAEMIKSTIDQLNDVTVARHGDAPAFLPEPPAPYGISLYSQVGAQ